MDFNFETFKGLLDRGIVALVAWAAGAGYIPADLVGALTPFLMAIPPLVFAWWFNRSTSLVYASKVAAEATNSTDPQTIRVAEEAVKELKTTLKEQN